MLIQKNNIIIHISIPILSIQSIIFRLSLFSTHTSQSIHPFVYFTYQYIITDCIVICIFLCICSGQHAVNNNSTMWKFVFYKTYPKTQIFFFFVYHLRWLCFKPRITQLPVKYFYECQLFIIISVLYHVSFNQSILYIVTSQ